MTPEGLIQVWNNDELIHVSNSTLYKLPFSELTKEFLNKGFIEVFCDLAFDYLKGEIQLVSDMWDLDHEEYKDVYAIGFNGSGDPICIDVLDDEKLIYLNHDNDFEEVYINKNIERFSEMVVRVSHFDKTKTKVLENSLWTHDFTDENFDKLKNDLKLIDPLAFEIESSFWRYHIENELWFREDERKKARLI
ncbi:hypothetical protein [uncultured Roseivirga sp.]|uniref:hypothetical protein n=1 Tax=uncultured Roseivirga sp. TaxID=543088 RepID=UPI0030DC392E|tara:strand:+ start:146833 stop:147408 length:576 start_codon:yes stop_codon:yes gene_type:complete